MERLRICTDTSVIGGCFDEEFALWSNRLVRDFRTGRLAPVLSEVTAAEVQGAPQEVWDLHEELVLLAGEILKVTAGTLALVDAYEARGVLGSRYRNDMLHIALATRAGVDALVSWNFKHIVRLEKIRLFNEVNIELGKMPLNILSPREVARYEGR
jgi:predicted nucleic acid-binding protein